MLRETLQCPWKPGEAAASIKIGLNELSATFDLPTLLDLALFFLLLLCILHTTALHPPGRVDLSADIAQLCGLIGRDHLLLTTDSTSAPFDVVSGQQETLTSSMDLT